MEDLEKAGINVIQIDEAALREGLPLRKSEQAFYLDWAVHSFRITNCGVVDTTQVYSLFISYLKHLEVLLYVSFIFSCFNFFLYSYLSTINRSTPTCATPTSMTLFTQLPTWTLM